MDHECVLFCQYLTEQKPSPYVLEKYAEGHSFRELSDGSGRFDRFLVRAAGRNVFTTGLVDAYCGIFSRRSLFRKKMMLLLAILECSYPTHGVIDSAEISGRGTIYLKFLGHAFSYLLKLALSLPFLMALYLADRYRSQKPLSG